MTACMLDGEYAAAYQGRQEASAVSRQSLALSLGHNMQHIYGSLAHLRCICKNKKGNNNAMALLSLLL